MNERGIGRVVAVGASNLTRGFHAVVATARGMWGPDIEVVAALGHGRIYGGPSVYFGRRIPGILESGLWTDPAYQGASGDLTAAAMRSRNPGS